MKKQPQKGQARPEPHAAEPEEGHAPEHEWTPEDVERTLERVRHMYELHAGSELMQQLRAIACARAAEGRVRD